MWGTMCAMTSRPYGWGLGNIAKSEQETANSETFSFFFKNCHNDSTEIFYTHFTLYGDLCVQ